MLQIINLDKMYFKDPFLIKIAFEEEKKANNNNIMKFSKEY